MEKHFSLDYLQRWGKDIAINIAMLQSGRTTRDLLRTSKFSVQVVLGQAIKKVKVEHCTYKKVPRKAYKYVKTAILLPSHRLLRERKTKFLQGKESLLNKQ